ncbi:hypothetical protein [Microbacterium lacus]|uniref:hypothetical protein n=1 Tax=Microbacterium lacus TaxID=415217 RepID=UPI000C2CAC03|nr:hypothetical protein [Microbacterium lacus]
MSDAPIPSIGRIVHYTLSESDAEAINRRRDDAVAAAHNPRHADRQKPMGEQVHFGNPVREGDVFPMIIVRVWGTTAESVVNGQVLLDGNDSLWVTSVGVGEGPRRFVWPPRV